MQQFFAWWNGKMSISICDPASIENVGTPCVVDASALWVIFQFVHHKIGQFNLSILSVLTYLKIFLYILLTQIKLQQISLLVGGCNV